MNRVDGLDELKSFGFSLSSGVDVDNNAYNGLLSSLFVILIIILYYCCCFLSFIRVHVDLLVGAYESKTAVLFRLVTVLLSRIQSCIYTMHVHVHTYIVKYCANYIHTQTHRTLSIAHVTVNASIIGGDTILLTGKATDFTLSVCARYNGRGLDRRPLGKTFVSKNAWINTSNVGYPIVSQNWTPFNWMPIFENIVFFCSNPLHRQSFFPTETNLIVREVGTFNRLTFSGKREYNGSFSFITTDNENCVMVIVSIKVRPIVSFLTVHHY